MGRRAAFFDVDETLLDNTSMFGFLEYHLQARGQAEQYLVIRAALRELAARGIGRVERNRVFHRYLRDHPVAQVADHGRAWFAAELATGGVFKPAVLDRLRAHQQANDLVVLVSGSFPACLEPLAREVAVTMLLCTQPRLADGCYTGEVEDPMIGEAKAVAGRDLARRHGICLRTSFGYGDHVSDLPLLELLGHPVVVGNDPEMVEHAELRGWERLASTAVSPTP